MHSPEEVYKQRISVINKQLQQLLVKRRWTSAFRIIFFLATAILFYAWSRLNQPLLVYAFLCAALFLIAIRIDSRLYKQIVFNRKKIIVNENEIAILNNRQNIFNDGQLFNPQNGYSSDLDVFGRFSLFHLLNRCTSIGGLQWLATRLQSPLQSKTEIENYQQAATTISTQTTLREDIIANGLLLDEKQGGLQDVAAWIQSDGLIYQKKLPQILRFVFPFINISLCLYWIFADQYIPFAIGAVLSWIYLGRHTRYIHEQHSLVSKKQAILYQYAAILQRFTTVEENDAVLLKTIKAEAGEAFVQIKKLSRLTELFDQRLNVFAFVLLNTFFLYDLQIIIALEKWKAANRSKFNSWLQAVADIEYIVSLAAFRFNNPVFCTPLITATQQPLQATAMSHPLIPAAERVLNDFSIGDDEKLMLITGSNMSGKSTFLRSIGVNMVLAQSGAVVCAASFSCSPMQILTCMRVNDNLEEHTSYFMAELKRLQSIVHALQQKQYSLVLIDEILRGTNSDDKHFGSIKFIEQLIQYNTLSMFATHDLILGEMEKTHPGIISNYCFESEIKEDELLFDYKLRKGLAKNRNASFLMKKMEIINQ